MGYIIRVKSDKGNTAEREILTEGFVMVYSDNGEATEYSEGNLKKLGLGGISSLLSLIPSLFKRS